MRQPGMQDGPQVADVAVVGLGVMGAGLARNLRDHGFGVAGYDVDPRSSALLAAEDGVLVRPEMGQTVALLRRPRIVLVVVPAGPVTDRAVTTLIDHLDAGDVVVDCGNAHPRDTRRRQRTAHGAGIEYLGAGVSGGEEGARHGPSITCGGSAAAYRIAGPVLRRIAAREGDAVRCAHVGDGGAGHFAKMVHNGIEYAQMQVIAESYDLLVRSGLDHAAIGRVFRAWDDAALRSYLVGMTADIVTRSDPRSGRPFPEVVDDAADPLGTGRWTAEEALRLGVPAPLVTAAVHARSASNQRARRSTAADTLGPDSADGGPDLGPGCLGSALEAAFVVGILEGLDLLAAGIDGESIDTVAVLDAWRAGCVIRGRTLEMVADALDRTGSTATLLDDDAVAAAVVPGLAALRRTVAAAAVAGVAVPGFGAALGHLELLRSDPACTRMIQAQRDYMGAHGYHRVDTSGTFHLRWSGAGEEIVLDGGTR